MQVSNQQSPAIGCRKSGAYESQGVDSPVCFEIDNDDGIQAAHKKECRRVLRSGGTECSWTDEGRRMAIHVCCAARLGEDGRTTLLYSPFFRPIRHGRLGGGGCQPTLGKIRLLRHRLS
jgi:hypothetical protein